MAAEPFHSLVFPAQAGIHVNVLDFVVSGGPILTIRTNCKSSPHACPIPCGNRPSGLRPSSRNWWDRSLPDPSRVGTRHVQSRRSQSNISPRPRGNENKPFRIRPEENWKERWRDARAKCERLGTDSYLTDTSHLPARITPLYHVNSLAQRPVGRGQIQ